MFDFRECFILFLFEKKSFDSLNISVSIAVFNAKAN